MEGQVKVAKQRLSVLELVEELGNVSEACRRRGMDRASFYEWKRRFQTQGLEGLKDYPPIAKSHPQAVPPEIKQRIVDIALDHPSYGCNKVEKMLSLESRYVSNVLNQKILIDHGLESATSAGSLSRENRPTRGSPSWATRSSHREAHPLHPGTACGAHWARRPTLPGHIFCRNAKGCRPRLYAHVIDTYVVLHSLSCTR